MMCYDVYDASVFDAGYQIFFTVDVKFKISKIKGCYDLKRLWLQDPKLLGYIMTHKKKSYTYIGAD